MELLVVNIIFFYQLANPILFCPKKYVDIIVIVSTDSHTTSLHTHHWQWFPFTLIDHILLTNVSFLSI